MNWRFAWVYRVGLAVLLALSFWSVWAGAQELTNLPPATAPAATSPPGLLNIKLSEHALTFGLDRVELLRETPLFGQPLWKYLASLIYILLAFYVAKVLDFIVNVWLKRLVAKTETKYDDLLLELLRGPVKVVAFVIFLNIGLGVFEWPARAQNYIARGFIVVVACSVAYVALKIVDLLLGVWREKIVSPQDRSFADQLLPFVSKVVKTVLIIALLLGSGRW